MPARYRPAAENVVVRKNRITYCNKSTKSNYSGFPCGYSGKADKNADFFATETKEKTTKGRSILKFPQPEAKGNLSKICSLIPGRRLDRGGAMM
jgi:hypothetical protein